MKRKLAGFDEKFMIDLLASDWMNN